MQSADVGQGNHLTRVRWLDSSAVRRIFVERQVRPRPMIVAQVGSDYPP